MEQSRPTVCFFGWLNAWCYSFDSVPANDLCTLSLNSFAKQDKKKQGCDSRRLTSVWREDVSHSAHKVLIECHSENLEASATARLMCLLLFDQVARYPDRFPVLLEDLRQDEQDCDAALAHA